MPVSVTSRALDTRFDRRLAEILDYATEIFAEKGYEGASMRDLSRLSGISLAGLYYYFESKEEAAVFYPTAHLYHDHRGVCVSAWRRRLTRKRASGSSSAIMLITRSPSRRQ